MHHSRVPDVFLPDEVDGEQSGQRFRTAYGAGAIIACGSVKVVFVSRKNLAAVPVERFNNPRGTIMVSSVEGTAGAARAG